jgi:hypothetical protein
MRLFPAVAIALLALVVPNPVQAQAGSGSSCRPMQPLAENVRAWMRTVFSENDGGRERKLYGLPPVADTSEIDFVIDEEVCRRAAVADALRFNEDTLSPQSVYVLRLGPNRLMVFNFRGPGRPVYSLYDAQFWPVPWKREN